VLLFSCVKERTLRLWVSRYNELGVDGLIYRPQAGRPRKMKPPQVISEIIPLLEDPSENKGTDKLQENLLASVPEMTRLGS
jgi:transposase